MKTKKPLVTVLMCVYNTEPYLHEAMDSILNQTFKDFEFLIINDGSTDGSVSIIESYQDEKIRLVHNEKNSGIVFSANRGLQLARGKYIARMDSDDISHKERLEKQVRILEQRPSLAALGTGWTHIDSNGQIFDRVHVVCGSEKLKEILKTKNCMANGSSMLRKSVMDEIGGYRSKLCSTEDYDVWTRIIDKYDVDNIDESLYFLRRGISSVSTRNFKRQITQHILITQLSKERREKGFDSLDTLHFNSPKDIMRILQLKYQMSKQEIHAMLAFFYNDFYLQHLNSDKLGLALSYWFKAFLCEPQPWKIKKLFSRLWKKYSQK